MNLSVHIGHKVNDVGHKLEGVREHVQESLYLQRRAIEVRKGKAYRGNILVTIRSKKPVLAVFLERGDSRYISPGFLIA